MSIYILNIVLSYIIFYCPVAFRCSWMVLEIHKMHILYLFVNNTDFKFEFVALKLLSFIFKPRSIKIKRYLLMFLTTIKALLLKLICLLETPSGYPSLDCQIEFKSVTVLRNKPLRTGLNNIKTNSIYSTQTRILNKIKQTWNKLLENSLPHLTLAGQS